MADEVKEAHDSTWHLTINVDEQTLTLTVFDGITARWSTVREDAEYLHNKLGWCIDKLRELEKQSKAGR